MAIHHGDIFHLETLDTARHKVDDAVDLRFGERLPIPQRHHN
mgnify:CR=1 FL=1